MTYTKTGRLDDLEAYIEWLESMIFNLEDQIEELNMSKKILFYREFSLNAEQSEWTLEDDETYSLEFVFQQDEDIRFTSSYINTLVTVDSTEKDVLEWWDSKCWLSSYDDDIIILKATELPPMSLEYILINITKYQENAS